MRDQLYSRRYHTSQRRPVRQRSPVKRRRKNYRVVRLFFTLVIVSSVIFGVLALAASGRDAPSVGQNITGEDSIASGGFQEQTAKYFDTLAVDDSLNNAVVVNGLPLLVNATHLLNSGWKPNELVFLVEYIPSYLAKIKGIDIQGDREAADQLIRMFEAATGEGISDWQVSAGWRSFEYQQALMTDQIAQYMKEGMTRSNAENYAKKYVAAVGASEHHTGLAFDITVPGTTFEGTKQCNWLASHCAEFGYIVRYTADKEAITGIAAEPWHIRYVGVEAAQEMTRLNMCLEEYVAWKQM